MYNLARVDTVRDKPSRSWRGRIARTAESSYNGVAADNQGSLRQGMPEVTPVEIRAAVAHSAQEPAEATQVRLNDAHERRRNLRPEGRGGCQVMLSPSVVSLMPGLSGHFFACQNGISSSLNPAEYSSIHSGHLPIVAANSTGGRI